MKWTAPKTVPQYINNRLIVDNIDVTDQFKITETPYKIIFIHKVSTGAVLELDKDRFKKYKK